jgi:hypothetical protein
VLFKWLELYDKYLSVIPDDLKDACRALMSKLKTRDVEKFRNSFVGHIGDNETNKPISNQDAEDLMDKITNGDRKAFLLWLNNPNDNIYPKTVVSIFSEVRNRIRDDNKLKKEEVFPE